MEWKAIATWCELCLSVVRGVRVSLEKLPGHVDAIEGRRRYVFLSRVSVT